MNFTREPIIESIVTPREGCKLVVRNSKAAGQEEYFVDAIEIVAFGHALFFRSLERPKNFLVPVSDYEVLEVRETRMMLKLASVPEAPPKAEPSKVKRRKEEKEKEEKEDVEVKGDKKKERRRRRRRKDGKDEEGVEAPASSSVQEAIPRMRATSSLLPPPTTLISESISRYKEMMAMQQEEVPPLPAQLEEDSPLPPPIEPSQEQLQATVEELGITSAPRFIKRLASEREEEREADEE
ncbi:MAG: hypothetical protein JSR80_01130 [Verrucomicrobia bacterium]|nr:hypothetical protein [Verrucomicrobiota bacterium]